MRIAIEEDGVLADHPVADERAVGAVFGNARAQRRGGIAIGVRKARDVEKLHVLRPLAVRPIPWVLDRRNAGDALAQLVPARLRVEWCLRRTATAREQLLGLRLREAPAQHDAVGGVKPIVGEGGTQDAELPAEIRKIVHWILAGAAEEPDLRPERPGRPRSRRQTPKQDGEGQ